MRPSQPPAVATRLLERLGSGQNRHVLAGDLIEQYRQGRSRAWYWRQVVTAIVVTAFHEVREHWVIAIRALVIGWSFITLFGSFVAPRLLGMLFPVLMDRGWFMSQWRVDYWYPIWAVTCAAGFTSGWIVARTHRSYRTAIVFLFAISVAIVQLPALSKIAIDAFRDPAAWSWALSIYLTTDTVSVLSILIGGLCRVPTRYWDQQVG